MLSTLLLEQVRIKTQTTETDVLHQNLVANASRQSDREMSASECVGNMFLIMCSIHTYDGSQLFQDGLQEIGISLWAVKDCLKLQLLFEKWVNNSNTIEDVSKACSHVSVPRTDGHGWNIPRMHSLAKMVYNMKQFGCGKNFSGQTGERALKSIVKKHAQQTQRWVDVFASQCADQQFESSVYERAYNDIKHFFGENYSKANSSEGHTLIM